MTERAEKKLQFVAGVLAALAVMMIGYFAGCVGPAQGPVYHDATPAVATALRDDQGKATAVAKGIGAATQLGTDAQKDVREGLRVVATAPAAGAAVAPLTEADGKLTEQGTVLSAQEAAMTELVGSLGQAYTDLKGQEGANAALEAAADKLAKDNAELTAWKNEWQDAWFGPRIWNLFYWALGLLGAAVGVGVLCLVLGYQPILQGASGIFGAVLKGVAWGLQTAGTFLVHLLGPVGHWIDEHIFAHFELKKANVALNAENDHLAGALVGDALPKGGKP